MTKYLSTKFIGLRVLSNIVASLICSIGLHAQYHIDGDVMANLGETKTYSVEDNYGYPPYGQDPYYYDWYVDGLITATNSNYYGSYGIPAISIYWNYPGTNYIFVDIYDDYFNDYYYYDLEVEVIGTLPDDPNDPTSNNNTCNPIITRSGVPQNGDIWYWQGKDANGTSTTKGSGTTYIPNEGSGTYYIRALGANNVWSIGSASVEVTIASPTLWYTDTDNDGLGDPASAPISSCTQLSGRVSNNFDECPAQAGNLLNNGCPGTGDLGSIDKNYVHTITPLVAVDNVSEITNDDDKIESVTYFDGLGRTIQNVGIRAGGQQQDIKIPVLYDEFGRQAKTYLPHATVTSSVSTYTDNSTIINGLNTYYLSKYPTQLNSGNPNAYSEKRFDDTPLSRVLESGTPGEDWLIDPNSDNDHTTKNAYGTNAEDEVYKINYPGAGQSLSISSFYTKGILLKNTVKNANWKTADGKVNTRDVFTDKSGKKIAEFSYMKESSVLKTLKTYYVYDDVGNMVYVFTPKLFTNLGSGTTITTTHLNDLVFQYKYDIYNRQIEQKVPGKKLWEYMVYDQLDRPILTQDQNLKDEGKWLFTKYDAFGRAVYSGLYSSGLTRSQLQTAVDNYISGNTNNLSNIESRTTASSIGGVTINYSNDAYPTSGLEVLTVNYYDDYSFSDADKPTTPTEILGQPVTTRTKGLPISSWTKTLGASTWAKSYTYYNDKASAIYVHEKNHLGGYTQNKSILDFRGKVKASLTEHKKSATDTPLIIKDYFTYDHAERPLSHTQVVGGDANVVDDYIVFDDESPSSDTTIGHEASQSITLSPGFTALPGFEASIEAFDRELIAYNIYDELGQFVSKKVGGEAEQVIANSMGLQTIDYTYDIRGALKAVNDVDNIGSDLFAYELNYESGEGANFNAPQYNGNISQMVWKSAKNSTKKSYYYDYDHLNRFSKGRYGEGSGLTSNWQKFEVNVTGYDHNGNITGLTRKGGSTGSTIDNLTYHYDTGNGNQLMKIVDASGAVGFTNGTTGSNEDYEYDDNGNLIKDLNKNISLIEYNHLDLVTKVTFTNGAKIEFLYDASGTKLQMKYVNGGATTTTDYLGGFQYQNGALQFFPTVEGYFEVTNIPPSGEIEGAYVYTLKDHLGNNRVAFKDANGDNVVNSTDILSSTDYYPMGMPHYGEYIANSNYNYKYQGKEKLLASGYNMYDFGSRMYDASVGRWFNTDPQNQFGSPYLAMGNNWIIATDPNGEVVPLLIIGGAALIGGAINVAANWDRIDNFWEGAGHFVTGAGTGVASVTLGPGGYIAASAVAGGLDEAIQGGGLDQIIKGSVQSGISSVVGLGVGKYVGKFGGVVLNKLNVTSPLIKETVAGAVGGSISGGLTGGVFSASEGGNFADGFWQGAKSGAVYGGIGAGGQSIVNNYASGYNPFTGNALGLDKDGNFIKWPDNDGFADKIPKLTSLESGQVIDRIGNNDGSFATDSGTPAENRALRPGTDLSLKKEFRVAPGQKIDGVKYGRIAPWFGQPGGGVQYLLPKPVQWYLDNKILIEIK